MAEKAVVMLVVVPKPWFVAVCLNVCAKLWVVCSAAVCGGADVRVWGRQGVI